MLKKSRVEDKGEGRSERGGGRRESKVRGCPAAALLTRQQAAADLTDSMVWNFHNANTLKARTLGQNNFVSVNNVSAETKCDSLTVRSTAMVILDPG